MTQSERNQLVTGEIGDRFDSVRNSTGGRQAEARRTRCSIEILFWNFENLADLNFIRIIQLITVRVVNLHVLTRIPVQTL